MASLAGGRPWGASLGRAGGAQEGGAGGMGVRGLAPGTSRASPPGRSAKRCGVRPGGCGVTCLWATRGLLQPGSDPGRGAGARGDREGQGRGRAGTGPADLAGRELRAGTAPDRRGARPADRAGARRRAHRGTRSGQVHDHRRPGGRLPGTRPAGGRARRGPDLPVQRRRAAR